MKRSLVLLMVTLCTVLLVGCGSSKKLQCSADVSSQVGYGTTASQNVEVTYKGSKIQTILMKINVTLPDSLKSNVDQIYNQIKSNTESSYGKIGGVTVNVEKTSDSTIVATINLDYANMTADQRKAAGFDGDNETYAVAKADLESAGYTCK